MGPVCSPLMKTEEMNLDEAAVFFSALDNCLLQYKHVWITLSTGLTKSIWSEET